VVIAVIAVIGLFNNIIYNRYVTNKAVHTKRQAWALLPWINPHTQHASHTQINSYDRYDRYDHPANGAGLRFYQAMTTVIAHL
jgi:hypothetical protein